MPRKRLPPARSASERRNHDCQCPARGHRSSNSLPGGYGGSRLAIAVGRSTGRNFPRRCAQTPQMRNSHHRRGRHHCEQRIGGPRRTVSPHEPSSSATIFAVHRRRVMEAMPIESGRKMLGWVVSLPVPTLRSEQSPAMGARVPASWNQWCPCNGAPRRWLLGQSILRTVRFHLIQEQTPHEQDYSLQEGSGTPGPVEVSASGAPSSIRRGPPPRSTSMSRSPS